MRPGDSIDQASPTLPSGQFRPERYYRPVPDPRGQPALAAAMGSPSEASSGVSWIWSMTSP